MKNLVILLLISFVGLASWLSFNPGKRVPAAVDEKALSCQDITKIFFKTSADWSRFERLNKILLFLEKRYKTDETAYFFKRRFLEFFKNKVDLVNRKVEFKDHFKSSIFVYKNSDVLLVEIPHIRLISVDTGKSNSDYDETFRKFFYGLFMAIRESEEVAGYQEVKIVAGNVVNEKLAKNLNDVGFTSSFQKRSVTDAEIKSHYKENNKLFKDEKIQAREREFELEDELEDLEEGDDFIDDYFGEDIVRGEDFTDSELVAIRYKSNIYPDNFNENKVYPDADEYEDDLDSITFELSFKLGERK